MPDALLPSHGEESNVTEVTPHIVVRDAARAAERYERASRRTLGGTYGALTITTDAVDELWGRALAEGAHVHSPLQDAFKALG
jgi:hypothetical protein